MFVPGFAAISPPQHESAKGIVSKPCTVRFTCVCPPARASSGVFRVPLESFLLSSFVFSAFHLRPV